MTSQQAHTECVEVEDTQMGGAPLTKAVSSVATSGPEVDVSLMLLWTVGFGSDILVERR